MTVTVINRSDIIIGIPRKIWVLAISASLRLWTQSDSLPQLAETASTACPASIDRIDAMEGRQLRMRMVTIEPGGVLGPIHDHIDRPGLVYMLQGTITDHRDGVATADGPGVGCPRIGTRRTGLRTKERRPQSRSRSTYSGSSNNCKP